ncbi:MAG: hypothetical protein ACOH1N_13700 [Lutibacter sp.]
MVRSCTENERTAEKTRANKSRIISVSVTVCHPTFEGYNTLIVPALKCAESHIKQLRITEKANTFSQGT